MQATALGVEMAYTDIGSGPPLCFIHGFPLSRGTWAKQAEAFKKRYRVLAPDLRGFGGTAAHTGAVPMAQFAEDLHALLGVLGTGPITLVGHSMGGYVALAFAKAYPQELRRLVLVGTKAGADSPEVAAARLETAKKVREEGPSAVVDAMAAKMLPADNPHGAMAAAVMGFMASATPAGIIGALQGMAERPDAGAWLHHIHVPTLVIAGADDRVIPPNESLALAKAIPGAQLRLIPKAGHLVAFEQAEAFNAALGDWLKTPIP